MTNPSPTLARLQAEHPKWCLTCGNWHLHRDGIHTCHENPVIAALRGAITDLEAQISERDRQLAEADEALIQHGYHQQGIPDLGVPHCTYDPEEDVVCDCGFQLGRKRCKWQNHKRQVESWHLSTMWGRFDTRKPGLSASV